MNLLPTYEQTIADRQGEIAIPDMSDAIWVRIETVLDVEMPVHDDTPAAPQGKPFYKKPAVWMIGAGILAIIIALFIISKNRRTAPPPPRNLPQPAAPIIKPDTTRKQDDQPPDKPKTIPDKKARVINEKHVADTTTHNPFIKVGTDSLFKKPPAVVTPPVIKIPPPDMMNPSMDTKQKKKYGVEVSDSDYRFNLKPKQ